MGGMAGATRQLQMQAGTDDKVCEGCRDDVVLLALLEVAGRLRVCLRYYCFGWECSAHGTGEQAFDDDCYVVLSWSYQSHVGTYSKGSRSRMDRSHAYSSPEANLPLTRGSVYRRRMLLNISL